MFGVSIAEIMALFQYLIGGAWSLFDRIYTAIDGSYLMLIVMFAIATAIVLIIFPMRGGSFNAGSSDDVNESLAQNDTYTYDHSKKKWRHTTTYTKNRRIKTK